MGEAVACFVFLEAGRGFVAPAALRGEAVPDEGVDFGELAAVGENPSEDFLVGATGERAGLELLVVDTEVVAEAAVVGFAEKLVVIEIVPDMAAHLRRALPGVQVICGDGFELPKVLEQAKAGRVGDVICGIPLVMLPFEAQQKIVSAMLEASPVRGFLHLSYCITSPLPSAKLGLTGRRQAWTIKNFPPGGVWRYAPINPAKAG